MADSPPIDRLSPAQIWQLRRLTTPTVYNGWELVTRHDPARDGFNLEPTVDFAPTLGPIAGRAITLVVRVGGPAPVDNRQRWTRFRQHVANQRDEPKLLVVQDLDKPMLYGSVFGEVAAATFRSLGCVGAIIDGGLRDVDETRATGFKVLARRACVGHGVGALVSFGEPVEVFGRRIEPGQLVHADQHGFLAVPPEDEPRLLEAAGFLDAIEAGLLVAARAAGKPVDAFLQQFDSAVDAYVSAVRSRFPKRGEW